MNMWLILVAEFVVMATLSTSCLTVNTTKTKRCFTELPVSLIENSIYVIDEEGRFYSSLDKKRLETNVKDYLSKNLKGLITSYEISFTYYTVDLDNKYVIDFSDDPMNVEINFKCNFYNVLDLNFYRCFELRNLYDERETN